jgi:Spy/CpxP family protein refolding chaperone
MKKLYIILTFLMVSFFAKAQEEQPPVSEQKQQEKIEALKVAFITKELDLTPDEAQKFWPVYNQYSKELKNTIKDNEDVIDRDEKVVNLRKRYKDQFTKVLGPDRMNRMFNAERDFRQLLIKSLRRQRQKANMDRPLIRKGL